MFSQKTPAPQAQFLKKCIKKAVCLIALISLCYFSVSGQAQNNKNSGWLALPLSVQPDSRIEILPGKRKYFSFGDQDFGIKIKNIYTQTLRISGQVYAKTFCGNEVKSDFSIELNPGEEETGGGLLNMSSLFSAVTKKDCDKGNRVIEKYLSDGKPLYQTDLIAAVGVRNLSVRDRKEIKPKNRQDNTQSSNNQNDVSEKGKSEDTYTVTRIAKDGNVSTESIEKNTIEEEKKRQAEEKRINDSIQNENTKRRVEGVQRLDKAEDDAFIGGALAFLALGSLMKDEYSDDPIALRYFLGLGLMNLPVIANTKYSGSTSKSSIEATFHPTFNLAFQAAFFNDKFISVIVTPKISYGFNALSTGITGSHLIYGGAAEVRAGKKREAKIKGYLELGWEKRSGDWEHDYDAGAASLGLGLGFSNLVLESSYNYSVLKYGGGVLLDLSNFDKETIIKAGYFFEKPSFFKTATNPLGVLNIQANISSFITVDFSYSKNYAAAGSVKYPSTFSHSNKDFFNLTILKNGLFGY